MQNAYNYILGGETNDKRSINTRNRKNNKNNNKWMFKSTNKTRYTRRSMVLH